MKKIVATERAACMMRYMNEWKQHLTPSESALLTEWETDERKHRDHAALYAVWRRRLADKVRARMKKEAQRV